MKPDDYILQKDLPEAKKGEIFTPSASEPGYYCAQTAKNVKYKREFIQSNKDWFVSAYENTLLLRIQYLEGRLNRVRRIGYLAGYKACDLKYKKKHLIKSAGEFLDLADRERNKSKDGPAFDTYLDNELNTGKII